MSYNLLYRGQFQNQETNPSDNSNVQQLITVDIYDTQSGEADEPEVIEPLEMAETPLVIEIVNSEENKFSVVRPKQANISINTSDTIGIETFCEGGDNRYYVEIYSPTETLFLGFLSISDLNEAFQPDPNVMTLTAFDGLGFLEGEPVTDFDGNNPSFENKIIDYIVWSLSKSGLSLPIKAVMNVRERYARPLNREGQSPLNAEAIFLAPGSGNKIRLDDTPTNRAFFYVGQIFTTTDADVNTGPFTVTSIATAGTDIEIFVEETVSAYAATLPGPGATFTDITPAGHFYNTIYLDSKTWEGDDIGEMIDSIEVLKRCLLAQCYIVQKNGEWWIINVDEMRSAAGYYVAEFDEQGEFVAMTQEALTKAIGVSSPMQWMNDDADVTTERPVKKLELIYDYEYRKEFICNQDFERGTGPEPTNAESETVDYSLNCWEALREGTTPAELDGTPFLGSTMVLRKLFAYNYEQERYLVLETAGGFRHYFKSQGVRIAAKSKFDFAINYKYNSDYSAVRTEVAHVRLLGDDGNVYDWDYDSQTQVNQWVQKTTSDPVFSELVNDDITNIDTSEWLSFQATCAPVPVAGRLYIRLIMAQAAGNIKYFAGFRFDYIPRINATYRKFSGQKITITQQTDPQKYKAKIEETVFMSDAPDPNIKGALLKRGPELEIFSGEADFSGGFSNIQIEGDQRDIFQIGMLIRIQGSSDNDIEARIVGVSYALLTDLTTITLSEETVLETGVEVTIYLITYALANRFYDAATYPDRDFADETFVHPFGEIQAFGYWNQHNRVMRKFEGTIDRTESGTEYPDMVHEFAMTDPHENSLNKIFMLLHYSMDLNLCEWTGFFHEVEDSTIEKVNTGHSFKYITDE